MARDEDYTEQLHRDMDDHGGSSHSSMRESAPKSVEEAKHQYEQLKENNLQKIKSLGVEVDEDGQASVLGVPISKEMKPLADAAVDTIKPFIIDQSEKVYNLASSLAKKMGMQKSHTTVGLVAENVFRWGLVGTSQIFSVIRASNKYASERKRLFADLSPVMQATGANLSNNEVIKVAYDDLHANWISDLRKVVAEIPSLVPTAIFAWQDQMASYKRRKNMFLGDVDGTSKMDAFSKMYDHDLEKRMVIESKIQDRRAAIAKQYESDPAKQAAMLEHFDRDIAPLSRPRRFGEYGDDEHPHAHKESDPKDKWDQTQKVLWGILPLTSFFSQKLKSDINEQIKARKKRVRAWKMIEKLKEELENQCDDKRGRRDDYESCDRELRSKSAEDIRVTGMGNRDGEDINLKEFIIELFQQHERDREPNRNFHDKKSGKAIDPLKGSMLNQLTPLAEIVADHLADGTLSPDALYKLVGENKVIKHTPSGARVFVKEDELRKIIEKELAPVLGTRETIKMEEFMAKFANPSMIEDTLKKNLQNMHGLEKSLFASLFPDDILLQAGMKKKEILEIRKQSHDFSHDFVAATATYLAKKSPAELKEMGLTEKESDAIAALKGSVDSGDVDAIKAAVKGRERETLDAVRSAGLLEQMKSGDKGSTFWADRVKEMSATRAKIKANAAKAKENGEPDAAEKRAESRSTRSRRKIEPEFSSDRDSETSYKEDKYPAKVSRTSSNRDDEDWDKSSSERSFSGSIKRKDPAYASRERDGTHVEGGRDKSEERVGRI